MDILNMNEFAVHPRVIAPDGTVDTVHVQAKRRTTLPEGYKVDENWLASTERVSLFDNKTTRIPTAIGSGTLALTTSLAVGQGIHAGIAAPGHTASAADIQAAQAQALAQAMAIQANTQNQDPTPEIN